jgi:hypothetical protein
MKQIFILIIATAGTLLLATMMKDQGAPLITCNTSMGILNLEFAATPSSANEVLTAWQATPCNDGRSLVAIAIANTKLDFVFIAFYVLFFYMTSLILGQSLLGMAGKLGLWLRWGSVLAGLLDVVENLFMFNTLQGNITGMGTYATALCAKIKFGLVAACLLYLLLGLGWLLFNRKAKLVLNP